MRSGGCDGGVGPPSALQVEIGKIDRKMMVNSTAVERFSRLLNQSQEVHARRRGKANNCTTHSPVAN